MTARFTETQKRVVYRCFLSDLAGFHASSCSAPNRQARNSIVGKYQVQVTGKGYSHGRDRDKVINPAIDGGGGGIRTPGTVLAIHTLSKRAP